MHNHKNITLNTTTTSNQSPLTRISQAVLIGLLYYLAARLAQILAIPPGYSTPFWPAAGIAYIGILLWGKRIVPGVFVAVLFYELSFFPDWTPQKLLHALPVVIPVSLGSTLSAWCAARFTRRYLNQELDCDGYDFTKLLLTAGPLCATIAATLGSTTRALAGWLPWNAYPTVWFNWWFGDTVGVLVVTPIVFACIARKNKPWLARTIGVAGCFASLALWHGLTQMDHRAIAAQFQHEAKQRAQAIDRSLATSVKIAQSLSALFEASSHVTSEEFDAFTEVVSREQSISALHWAPIITDDHRADFESTLAQVTANPNAYISDITINGENAPSPKREYYCPILYSGQPDNRSYQLGVDICANPKIRSATQTARSSAQITISEPVEFNQSNTTSILAISTVYRKDAPRDTPVQRANAAIGFAVGVIDISHALQNVLSNLTPAGIDFIITDDNASSPTHYIYAHSSRSRPKPINPDTLFKTIQAAPTSDQSITHIKIGQRTWTFTAIQTRQAMTANMSHTPLIVLASGLVISILLMSYLSTLGNRAARDEQLVQQRTAELDDRNKSLNTALEQLTKARTQAEAASDAKSQFLANMSHEIRTPMTAILGYAELLADPSHNNVQRDDCIATIRQNGEYLLTIINDILDLSKIEAGKLNLQRIDCSPTLIIQDVATTMAERAKQKHLELETCFEYPIPQTIHTDPTRLRQILINLVANAIKFTTVGSIKIVARLQHDSNLDHPQFAIDVIDTGIGLNKQQQSELFTPFTQADNSYTRPYGGTGLGLTISQRFAHALGGAIQVQSNHGKGSTFTAIIDPGPLEQVAMIEDKPHPVQNDQHHIPAVIKTTTTLTKPLQGLNILVAEDVIETQELLQKFLTIQGANAHVVSNGQDACERALEQDNNGTPFDLILMDMQMPILDGYQATTHLRNAGYKKPIVALTAHAMTGDRQRCLDAGCDAYATKPISKAALTELVIKTTHRNNPATPTHPS